MNNNQQGLRSIYLEVENFKNIEKYRIDINGSSLLIVGKNGAGKSTLMQAMMSPMNARVLPLEPIKKGEQAAKIVHQIAGHIDGEYKEYTMEIYFSEKNKKGRLVVKNEKGETISSPATIIKNIIGNVSFDVTGWLNAKPAEKLKMIKNLTGNGKKIDVIVNNIKELKEERKKKSDKADELKAVMNNHEFSKEQVQKYSKPVPIEPIQAELSEIGQAQNAWDDIKNQVNGFYQSINNCEGNITSNRQQINSLYAEIKRIQDQIASCENNIKHQESEIVRHKENIAVGEQWLSENTRASVEDINLKLGEAMAHNEKHNRILILQNQHRDMTKLVEEVNNLDVKINICENEKMSLIENSQLPIKGLSFNDEEMFINGLPLDDSQVNTASLWDISVDIAMAMNPNYKGIFLPDGSMFDRGTLKAIIEKIEQRGYFAICEIVDFNEGDLHVEFAEKVLN